MVEQVLRVFDLLRRPLARAGVDYPQFRLLLGTKLRLDTRRRTGLGALRRSSSRIPPFVFTLGLFTVFGLFMGGVVLAARPWLAFTFVHTFVLTLAAMTLVADFSAVLLDTTDHRLLGPLPVTPRTVFAARLAHVVTYLSLITLSLSLGSLGSTAGRWGPAAAALLILTLATGVALMVALVTLVYLAAMRFLDPERVQSVIFYAQVLAGVTFFGGYQVLPRLMESHLLQGLGDSPPLGLYLFPPFWFAGPFELLTGTAGPGPWVQTLLAAVVPALALGLVVRLSSSFRVAPAAKRRGSRRSRPSWIGRRLCRRPAERTGFELTRWLTARSRPFKLRVYPMFGMLLVLPLIFLFHRQEGLQAMLSRLRAGDGYLFALYLVVAFIPTVAGEIAFSDHPEAAWLYAALPLERPGPLLLGSAKAVMVRFMLPVILIADLLIVAIWGGRVLPDLLLAGVVAWLMAVLYTLMGTRALPFSQPLQMSQSTSRVAQTMGLALLVILLGMGHWLALRAGPWGVPVALAVLVVIAWRSTHRLSALGWKAVQVG